MATITIRLNEKATTVALEAQLGDCSRALATLRTLLPALRLAGVLVPRSSRLEGGQDKSGASS